jgi:hypothetical protein
MKLKLMILLIGMSLFVGCATQVAIGPFPPEPVVYYGWYGGYYGPYYWGPTGEIVFGAPYGWRGYYYHGLRYRGPVYRGSEHGFHSLPHSIPHR